MVSSVYIRPLLALLLMAALGAVVATVYRDDRNESTPARPFAGQLPQHIDVALKKARFSEIQDGRVVWNLVAERVDYDKDGDMAYLTGIRMEFQRNGSQGGVIATADSGEYLSEAKTVRLKGRVKLVTEDGASFMTNTILYRGADTRFTTSDPVTFRQQRLQLDAVGMELSVKSQRARFLSAVDATIITNLVFGVE